MHRQEPITNSQELPPGKANERAAAQVNLTLKELSEYNSDLKAALDIIADCDKAFDVFNKLNEFDKIEELLSKIPETSLTKAMDSAKAEGLIEIEIMPASITPNKRNAKKKKMANIVNPDNSTNEIKKSEIINSNPNPEQPSYNKEVEVETQNNDTRRNRQNALARITRLKHLREKHREIKNEYLNDLESAINTALQQANIEKEKLSKELTTTRETFIEEMYSIAVMCHESYNTSKSASFKNVFNETFKGLTQIDDAGNLSQISYDICPNSVTELKTFYNELLLKIKSNKLLSKSINSIKQIENSDWVSAIAIESEINTPVETIRNNIIARELNKQITSKLDSNKNVTPLVAIMHHGTYNENGLILKELAPLKKQVSHHESLVSSIKHERYNFSPSCHSTNKIIENSTIASFQLESDNTSNMLCANLRELNENLERIRASRESISMDDITFENAEDKKQLLLRFNQEWKQGNDKLLLLLEEANKQIANKSVAQPSKEEIKPIEATASSNNISNEHRNRKAALDALSDKVEKLNLKIKEASLLFNSSSNISSDDSQRLTEKMKELEGELLKIECFWKDLCHKNLQYLSDDEISKYSSQLETDSNLIEGMQVKIYYAQFADMYYRHYTSFKPLLDHASSLEMRIFDPTRLTTKQQYNYTKLVGIIAKYKNKDNQDKYQDKDISFDSIFLDLVDDNKMDDSLYTFVSAIPDDMKVLEQILTDLPAISPYTLINKDDVKGDVLKKIQAYIGYRKMLINSINILEQRLYTINHENSKKYPLYFSIKGLQVDRQKDHFYIQENDEGGINYSITTNGTNTTGSTKKSIWELLATHMRIPFKKPNTDEQKIYIKNSLNKKYGLDLSDDILNIFNYNTIAKLRPYLLSAVIDEMRDNPLHLENIGEKQIIQTYLFNLYDLLEDKNIPKDTKKYYKIDEEYLTNELEIYRSIIHDFKKDTKNNQTKKSWFVRLKEAIADAFTPEWKFNLGLFSTAETGRKLNNEVKDELKFFKKHYKVDAVKPKKNKSSVNVGGIMGTNETRKTEIEKGSHPEKTRAVETPTPRPVFTKDQPTEQLTEESSDVFEKKN